MGAGTGLSGGALPLEDGVVVSVAPMNRILDIDLENRTVTAQAGVTNLAVSDAVRDHGFYYAPDPSSQLACTIGGISPRIPAAFTASSTARRRTMCWASESCFPTVRSSSWVASRWTAAGTICWRS